jgi:exosortase/archaeosortase family protein
MKKWKKNIAPYVDISLFVVALLAAHFFWKYTVLGDDGGEQVLWFGMDITLLFDILATHVASAVYWLVHLMRDTIHQLPNNTLFFDSGSGVHIVWSCTALKQSFIWLVIMLVARGSWLKKLWFIPLGWMAIYVFNLLRITAIVLIMEHHPELFELMHTYVFKYLFYLMMFGLWVWWAHRVRYPNALFLKEWNPQIKE